MQLLLENGIDINQTNKDEQNAFYLASERNHKEIVQLLIDQGIYINQTIEDGQNALHLASERNQKVVVQGARDFHEGFSYLKTFN